MNEILIAGDFGFGFTKGMTLDSAVSFPTAYAPVARELYNGSGRNRVHVLDEDWYFGEAAFTYSRAPIFSRDRKRSPEMLRVLFLSLVSELGVYSGNVQLHCALPVEWLQDADEIRSVLQGRHIGNRLDQGEKHIDVMVTGIGDEIDKSGVYVYPQPLATFLYHADESLWDDLATVLIIDVGTGTFNVAMLIGGEWVDERATSVPHGMGLVLEHTLQNQEQDVSRRDMPSIARKKLWRGDKQMLDYARQPIEMLADDLLQTVADIAGNISLTAVILTGGGARFVQGRVRDKFGSLVRMSEQPEMDNVRGLLEAGQ